MFIHGRRDKNAHTGDYIIFPKWMENTQEGGMCVYAVWFDIHIVSCVPEVIKLRRGYFLSKVFDMNFDRTIVLSDEDYPRFAFSYLFLGSSGGTFWDNEKEEYWHATKYDLTPQCEQLLNELSVLHGVKPFLLTQIDT